MSTVNATEYVAHPDKKVNDGRSMWDLLKGETSSAPAASALPKPSTSTSTPARVVPESPQVRPAANDSNELDSAISFLAAIASGGEVALASCVPDGPMRGAILDPMRQRVELGAWLRERNGRENVYFTINEPKSAAERTGRSDRLKKSDVAAIRGLAVDVDPRPDIDLATERARLLDMARGWLDHWLAPPTAIVDSGGGIQMLWLLRDPLPNTDANLAAVEAQAKALGQCVDSDRVQSLEHLFRVPGLRNLPTRKKRELGRGETTARLLHFAPTTRYTLETLAALAAPVFEAPTAVTGELDGFDYAEVIAAAEGEPLAARLATALTEMRKRRSVNTVLANSDRSARDFALAACCVEYGLTNPTDIGRVAFSLSPEKLLEKEGQGRGEIYAAGTIRRALAATKPSVKPSANDFFTGMPAAPGEQAAAPTRLELHIVGGGIDPKSIPVRKWIVEPQVPVGDVALCIGEPGVSKSTLALRTALAVATGREDILRGRDVSGGPITAERLHRSGAVLVYNAEDRLFEMQRRLRAAQVHYAVAAADMRHPIVLYSGVDMPTLKVMNRPDARGPLKRAEGADLLEEAIRRYDIKLLVADPLVALATGALENDNNDMDTVLQTFANMAAKLDIGMMLLHHTNKGGRDKAGDMGAARGASAIAGKVRVAFTLTKVTGDGENEAGWGLKAEEHLVRLDYAKRTLTKPGNETVIFKRASVSVGNGSGVFPQGVSDLFEASPLARLEAEGDAAPVLEVIDTKGRMLAAAQEASANAGAANVQIARAADAVLGGDTEAGLGDVWERLGKVLRDERVTRATGRDTLRVLVIDALAGGVEFERDGQIVRVEAVQIKRGKTAPWVIKRALRSVAKETA